MFLILIGVAVLAAVLLSGTGLLVVGVVNAVLAFWSNGVMANYTADPQAAPNFASLVSLVTAVASLVLLGVAVFT